MLRENPKSSGQADLYRARLESIIDAGHELVKLAGRVDWSGLGEDLSSTIARIMAVLAVRSG